jgi:hypothetical protein
LQWHPLQCGRAHRRKSRVGQGRLPTVALHVNVAMNRSRWSPSRGEQDDVGISSDEGASMKRAVFKIPFASLGLVVSLAACSGGTSSAPNPTSVGASGSAASAGAAGTGATAGATSASGGSGSAGSGGTASTGGAGADAGTANAGTVDAGAAGTNVDGSTDATTRAPLMGIVKMMVVGSSNELGTCWRALLWQELHVNNITNFHFVGQQMGGPNCGVMGWNDTALQAMSGIMITGIPASTYLGWFMANPPDIILMHFGGADILANKPVAGVMNAYATALDQARIVNPKVILLIAQHTPEGKPEILTLNAAIATWAPQVSTAESPVIAVDLYTGILPSDLSDGVHLNASGSQKVADRWYAALKPFFKP